MKPRRSARRLPTTQLSLPLQALQVTALDAHERAGLIAVLARLLLEAVPPGRESEGTDDAE